MAGRDARRPVPLRARPAPGGALRATPGRTARRRHTGGSARGSRPPTRRARGRSRQRSPSTSCRRATPDAPSSSLRLAAEQAFERLAHREALEHLTTASTCSSARRRSRAAGPRSSRCSRCSELRRSPRGAGRRRKPRPPSSGHTSWQNGSTATDDLGWALFRLGTLYEVRGDYERSDPLLEQALALSGPTASNGLLTDSHELLACSLFHQGVVRPRARARRAGPRRLRRAVLSIRSRRPTATTPAPRATAGPPSRSGSSATRTSPANAHERRCALADDPRRRHGYATALAQAAIVEQCRLDVAATRANAQAAIEAATRDGYRYRLAMATILHGWALAAEGVARAGDRRARARTRALPRDRRPHGRSLLLRPARRRALRAGHIDAAWAAVEAGLGHAPPVAGSSSRASSTDWPESSSCASADATRPRRACARRSSWHAARARPPSSCVRR